MSVRIPLRLAPSTTSTETGKRGLSLKLPVRIPGTPVEADRDTQLVRAVAGAVAICNPAEAAKLAEAIARSPAAALEPKIDTDALASVLEAVDAVRRDPSTAPAVNDVHRAVAEAIGADPALVAAGFASVSQAAARCDSARSWVGALQADLLSTAGRAAVRRALLDLVPSRAADVVPKRLSELEGRVEVLGTRVERLEKAEVP